MFLLQEARCTILVTLSGDVPRQNRSVKNRRWTWNWTLSCPVPLPQIFRIHSRWTASRSYKKRLKTIKTSLDKQERIIQACHNIRIPRHSLSLPGFSCFHTVLPLFLACLQSFKGLSKPFKAVLVLFPSKFVYWWPVCRSLVQHHPKIPPQYSFCNCKWNDTVAN